MNIKTKKKNIHFRREIFRQSSTLLCQLNNDLSLYNCFSKDEQANSKKNHGIVSKDGGNKFRKHFAIEGCVLIVI